VTFHLERLTPPGPAGISVLRLTGAEAADRLAALCDRALPPPGGLRLVRLAWEGEALDEALVCTLGRDRLELHLHGSPGLVAEVSRLLGGGEGPPARCVEEAALALLPRAPCEAAARLLLDQAQGALRRAVLAAAPSPATPGHWLRLWQRARPLLVPPRVVLAGPVNAGKSTLFNLLVGRRRVIVHDEEGTTRDSIAERVLLGPIAVDLFDTAGERPVSEGGPAAEVERGGQALAAELRAAADLVLWLSPVDRPAAFPGREPALELVSCADRADSPRGTWPATWISATADPEAARARVQEGILLSLGPALDGPVHVPGQGLPFTADLARGLEEDFQLTAGPERVAALEARLGAGFALMLP